MHLNGTENLQHVKRFGEEECLNSLETDTKEVDSTCEKKI